MRTDDRPLTTTTSPTTTAAATAARSGGHAPTALLLGLWRAKAMWRYLVTLGVGVMLAMTLVCLVPLLTQAASIAGLEAVLSSPSNPGTIGPGATNVVFAQGNLNAPTEQIITQAQQQLLGTIHGDFPGIPYTLGSPSLVIGDVAVSPVGIGQAAASSTMVSLVALNASDASAGYQLTSGRLPQPANGVLEIVVAPETATQLGLKLGDTFALAGDGGPALTLRIVGLGDVKANSSQPNLLPIPVYQLPDGTIINSGDPPPSDGKLLGALSYALVSLPAVETTNVAWTTLHPSPLGGPFNGDRQSPWIFSQQATVDFSHLTDAQAHRLLNLRPDYTGGDIGTGQIYIENNISYIIQQYKNRLLWGQVADYILLADVLGLVLLFVGLMLNSLVERQAGMLALLRSRGASRGQIARALLLQTGAVGILAIVAGALLAVPLARWLSGALISSSTSGVNQALAGNIFGVAFGPWLLIVIVGGLLMLVLLISAWRTAQRNVIAYRAEEARATRKPLWRRMYLDVIFALLALAGYALYSLATHLAGGSGSRGSTIETALSPLALVAPIFLMVAAALLVARGLPAMLRLAERLAERRSGAPAVLGLSQLARASAQAGRTIVLCALVFGYALFAIAAIATLRQYVSDSANYSVGADFGGYIATPGDAGTAGLSAETALFSQIPGVTSTALGFATEVSTSKPTNQPQYGPPTTFSLNAVDAASYAQTIRWPTQNSTSVTAAMALLQSQSGTSTLGSGPVVPAILDAGAAQTLNAKVGSVITLYLPEVPSATDTGIPFQVVGIVSYLPGVYEDGPTMQGGILADYSAFVGVYGPAVGGDSTALAPLAPNEVWLRTKSDPQSLDAIRTALASGPTEIAATSNSFYFSGTGTVYATDRWTYGARVNADPMYANFGGILGVSALVAALLALVGIALSTTLAFARDRQQLAVLLALGLPRTQVRRVLLWEVGVVLTLALGLGALLGVFLALATSTALPQLVLSSALGGPIQSGGPPAHIVWPWLTLGIAAAVVVLLCAALAQGIARAATRTSGESALRQIED